MIPKYLSPRNIYPIANRYQLVNNKPETEFILILDYLEDHRGRIIVRRIDEEMGWEHELEILIFSDGTSETIKIGKSFDNTFYLIFTTTIKLEKTNLCYDQKIPKVIIQTDENNKYHSRLHSNAILSIIDQNPEYEYRFFDATSRRKFIMENFSQNILDTYDFLVPGAYKSDLFRLCYLYLNGGCYLDNKTVPMKPFREWLDKNDEIILCEDSDPDRICNGYIFCYKGISYFMDAIINIVENVANKTYQKGTLGITGPAVLQKFFGKIPRKLKHHLYQNDATNNYHNTPTTLINDDIVLFYKFYKGYYHNLSKNHYSVYFKNKEVYYQSKFQLGDLLIFIYPNSFKEEFAFEVEDNIIIISRTDQNNGWKQNLKINLINQKTNKEYLLVVGSSNTSDIMMRLPEKILSNEEIIY